MDQQSTPVTQRTCSKCGYQAATAGTICPQCRRPLQTAMSIRIRGCLLMLCGGFLVLFMSYISFWMLGAASKGDPAGAKFNGTQEQLMMIAALCGLVILFGFISFVTGIFQLVFGRRNKIFVWIVFILGILLFAVGGYFVWSGK